MSTDYLWVPFTLVAAVGQVFRNGAQSKLTARIGSLGGTQVRFVWGLPFGLAIFALFHLVSGEAVPSLMHGRVLAWGVAGALCQIAATAFMLIAMGQRGFAVGYAYIKTEPVSVALLGLVLIGDRLPLLGWIAVVVVTVGVLIASLQAQGGRLSLGKPLPVLTGVVAGALFGLTSICNRAAIVEIPDGSFYARSLLILVVSLSIQTLVLGLWFLLRDARPFTGSVREWRLSLAAGALGGLSSACWFIGFSLTAAANVRTLSLVEMPVVGLVARMHSGKWPGSREWAGFALIVAGVTLLLVSHET